MSIVLARSIMLLGSREFLPQVALCLLDYLRVGPRVHRDPRGCKSYLLWKSQLACSLFAQRLREWDLRVGPLNRRQ
jgi:hypothetical protein